MPCGATLASTLSLSLTHTVAVPDVAVRVLDTFTDYVCSCALTRSDSWH